jgi:hypothetical protein
MIVVAGIPRDGQMTIVSKMTATATHNVRIAISVSRIKATVSQAIVPATRSVLTRISVSPIKGCAAKTSVPATRNVHTAISVSLTRATVGRATTLVQDRHPAPHHRATEASAQDQKTHRLRRSATPAASALPCATSAVMLQRKNVAPRSARPASSTRSRGSKLGRLRATCHHQVHLYCRKWIRHRRSCATPEAWHR